MSTSLKGKVVKIHSDFIYVKSGEYVYECKMRERLKKERVNVCTGDDVIIEPQQDADLAEASEEATVLMQAVVVEVLERRSYLPRPSIANADQVVVVTSIAQPELDFVQLNRYLCHAKLNDLPALICINKIDLEKDKNMLEKIRSIYEPLNYKVVFTSAKEGFGLENFKKNLADKVSIFAGMSGVGKSTLLNKLCPDLNLKTKKVSAKSGRGIHTTRHTELIDIQVEDGEFCQIADTPGFSYLKFDSILPSVVMEMFEEISALAKYCYFSDCLHLEEADCNVIKNLDKIDSARYESYKTFVQESFEYKKQVNYGSQKEEAATKTKDASGKGKKRLMKVKAQEKEDSRRKSKQKITDILNSDDLYYNDDDFGE